MRLVRLRVERFRGIKSLDWALPDRLVCLVGPGDSGKSTILEAVAVVASPRNTVSFDDDDFFGGSAAEGFSIEATFADLPVGQGLLAESRLGLLLGGVDADGGLHDEPGDHEATITVRLDVDDALDPTWRVVKPGNAEGRIVTARDRAALGVAFVGASPDRQFTFGRGSALARAAGESLDNILIGARRELRDSAARIDLGGLDPAISVARSAGKRMGTGAIADQLAAELEVSRVTGAELALHAGGVPVAGSGLGTRRLLALGLELLAFPTGGIVCLDEIESGLEPHRLRQLMAALANIAEGSPGQDAGCGQALFTSHSPLVIEELGARHLYTVRNAGGAVTITRVPQELTAVVRANAAALLGRRVVVAEGKTEIGLVRGHGPAWTAGHDGRSLGFAGVAVADGGGSEAARRALSLRNLGYPVLLFADSDRALSPPVEELREKGVEVVQWPGAMCTEQRLAIDLSWAALVTLFSRLPDIGLDPQECITKMLATEPARNQMKSLGMQPADIDKTLNGLLAAGLVESVIRDCLWLAATPKQVRGWFKLIDSGQVLGEVAAGDPELAITPAGRALSRVEAWCYEQ